MLGFAGCAHFEHAHAAGELGEAFLQLFLIVRAGGVGNLVLELCDAVLDILLLACAVHDGGVVLRDGHLFGRAEHLEGGLFEFETLLLADNYAAREDSDVFEHGLAAVTEAGSLDGANLELRAQAVYNERSESFAVNVLCNNEQGTAGLHGGVENGQEVVDGRNLLVVDEDIGVLHHALHLLSIGHEVGGEITAVELHAFHGLEHRVAAFCVFDGDHAVNAYGTHAVGNKFADFSVVVCGNGGHLLNLLIAFFHLLSLCLDAFHHFGNGLVDAALHVEGISARSHVLHAFGEDGLCEDGSGSGAVAGIVTRLAGHALNELCARVAEGVVEFDFLRYAHAVLSDAGCAEFFIDNHIAAFRTEGHFHCICKRVCAFAEKLAGFNVVFDFFCHGCKFNFL